MLGYDALNLDLAVFDDDKVIGSHVVTLVELEGRWIIQDACFNVEYRDQNDELVDLEKMLEYLDEKQDEQIRVVDESNIKKPLLSNIYLVQDAILYDIESPEQLESGQYIYEAEISLSKEPFCDLYSYFENDGYEANQIYLYEYPYALYLVDDNISNLLDYFSVKSILETRMN